MKHSLHWLLLSLCALVCSPVVSDTPSHTLLAADASTGRIALVNPDGSLRWEARTTNIHDLQLLRNGNVLFQKDIQHLVEMDPKTNAVVWEYGASRMNGNEGKPVEVHAFQRLRDGATMIAESGPARIIEVDRQGKLIKEIKLKVNSPSTHSDTRQARKLESGHYLVNHEKDGTVREYDGDGKVVWEFEVPLFDKEPKGGHGPEAWGNQTFAALRLKNGNTLISTGNGHGILEVTAAKAIVWQVKQNDLEGITLAWVTTLQVLPNGNIVLGNCHAGSDNPQIVEITREKKVVWTFKDFKNFGNALSNSVVVDGRLR